MRSTAPPVLAVDNTRRHEHLQNKQSDRQRSAERYWRTRRTSLPTNLKGAVIRQDVEA